jgi:hypothetical protein
LLKIAQRFNAGHAAFKQAIVPIGTAEIFLVPDETWAPILLLPSAKALGYFRFATRAIHACHAVVY